MRRPYHLRFTYSQFTVYLFITISLVMYYCPVRAQQIVNGKWVNGKYEDVSLSEALLQLSQEQTDLHQQSYLNLDPNDQPYLKLLQQSF